MSQLTVDQVNASTIQANSLSSDNGEVKMLRSNYLNVHVIQAQNGQLEITCTNDWQNQVEISQADISDADFIKILRNKVKLTISKGDPLYLSAVGKMVAE
jgi:hypothetical protein